MTMQDLFTKHQLYDKLLPDKPYDRMNRTQEIYDYIYGGCSIDMYCPDCGVHSVFYKAERQFSGANFRASDGSLIPQIKDGNYIIDAHCARKPEHSASIIIRVQGVTVIKIGQYPSLADILTPDLRKYKPAIGEILVKEWARGIGLAAHGIGAGAFVYLRRILESLTEEAHQRALQNKEWNEEEYLRSRFNERIALLDGYLPQVLIENKAAYSILSKGVHELDEDACLKHFDLLNEAIGLIAEERLSEYDREKRKTALKIALSSLKGSV